MRKYTDKEMGEIIRKNSTIEYLSFGQLFTLMYWSIFNRTRISRFVYNLDIGMAPIFAYQEAKKYK